VYQNNLDDYDDEDDNIGRVDDDFIEKYRQKQEAILAGLRTIEEYRIEQVIQEEEEETK
jgi:hypothetical protein